MNEVYLEINLLKNSKPINENCWNDAKNKPHKTIQFSKCMTLCLFRNNWPYVKSPPSPLANHKPTPNISIFTILDLIN